ncbi:hypothetical protein F4823DRAFT_58095 [Ustulina deusta]|nr:hypothetical protein F4823DRAFT_58095 [Ustulina deusta]
MIGRNPESANPIVMLCSTNKKALEAAEAAIRESGLLGEHKGFGLGAASLPLEHPAPVRRLSPNSEDHSFSAGSEKSDDAIASSLQTSSSFAANHPFHLPSDPMQHPPSNSSTSEASSLLIVQTLPHHLDINDSFFGRLVFASSTIPTLGRRILFETAGSHHAIAGVIIQVGENYYQLTVGHLFDTRSERSEVEPSLISLDDCHFDGQSDDDEHDSDRESEITGRGSATPEDAQSRDGSSSDSTSEESTADFNAEVHRNTHRHHGNEAGAFIIGCLPEEISFRSSIDYAMIALLTYHVKSTGRKINTSPMFSSPVRDVAEVGREERSIIVAINSTIIRGTLLPGKVSYRNPRTRRFEALVQVTLERELFEGDCGSPVLDGSTGSLYGHIVMGVAGTKVAYIVQAHDIFQDISSRTGEHVCIATREKDIEETNALPTRQHIRLPSDSEDTQSLFSYTSSNYSRASKISSNSSVTSPLASSRSAASTYSYSSYNKGKSLCPAFSTPSTFASLSSTTSTSSTSSPGRSYFSNMSTAGMSIPNGPTAHFSAADSLPCEFAWYSNCDLVFALNDVENWVKHIIADHLGEKLPTKCICWFCDDKSFDCKETRDRRANFSYRMYHIRDHFLCGKTLHDVRPDHYITKHIQDHGLISEDMPNAVRRYLEEPPDIYMLAAGLTSSDFRVRNVRRALERINPHDEERKDRRHKHNSGKSRK